MSTDNLIEDLDEPFDPHVADEALFGDHPDPYPVIEELRQRGPVVAGDYREIMGVPGMGDEGWAGRYLVLSFAAVDQVTNDPMTFSNHAFDSTLGRAFGRTVSVMDPPEHTRHRRILQKAFRPPIVAAWGNDIVAPVIDELIGEFRDSGRAELVEQFARQYSFGVIYRMLDLPREHIDTFYKLTVAQLFFYPGMTIAEEASAKLGRYFGRLLAERRMSPGSDIVSVLATTELDGEYLEDEVAISFLRQLINAGGDTTFRTTTVLLTGLLSNPDQLDAVRADRSLIAAAVEEALRWDGPVLASQRQTTVDTVLDGVPVPANSYLELLYGAANHDPAVFEHPERFDIHRPKHRHFGFSFGAHNCVGQVLARLEMTRAVNAMLDDLPNLRLDPDMPPPRLRGAMMRTPPTINVIFD